MDVRKRNQLIDNYFNGLDQTEYPILRSSFTDSIHYRYTHEEEYRGIDEVMDYFENKRRTANTTHHLGRRIHGEEASTCEGTVEGELVHDGHVRGTQGNFRGAYCNVFEFDEGDSAIATITIYRRFIE